MSSLNITQLLSAWQSGDRAALDKLAPVVYDELHRLAQHYMRGESAGHTLQATALVNEAYIRLIDTEQPWQSRAHFLGVAAQMMRRILVDHARARGSKKRGENRTHVNLDEATLITQDNEELVIELDDALNKLAKFDERKSKLIELRFFGGLTYEEAAEVLAISTTTLDRELRMAKAWLKQELTV
jgi:RNA polymerase sigma-70 factor, ECF subfamily